MNARHPHRRCDGVIRRDVLRVGGLTALGLGLPQWLRARRSLAAESEAGAPAPRARSCILVWLDGGPSHLETFDLKPHAPAEVRGPFHPIATAVPGISICELMPRTAQRLDRLSLIRSVTSPLGEHNFGAHYLLTGYKPAPALEYPSHGAVTAHVRGRDGVLPPNVAVPDFGVGGSRMTGRGFLPASCAPFAVGGDPAKPGFQVRDLELRRGLTLERLDRRRQFLQALDGMHLGVEVEPPDDPEFEQAYRLLTSRDAQRAFALEEEPPRVRQRYGPRTVGQSCLLARRLVERGVPFVTVNHRGWDTHENLYTQMKEGYTGAEVPVGLVPSLDLALSALLDDLHERGLLSRTLVVVMGEFGRTPRVNTLAGRDHWPRVFSVALAGGGIRGGCVLGESDAIGESPADRPVTPDDLAATIYACLGIPLDHVLHAPDGRPVRVTDGGRPVTEILA